MTGRRRAHIPAATIGLPCVLPANDHAEYGGTATLDSIIERARSAYDYRVGLHENYVDFYPNADCPNGWNPADVARDPSGAWAKAYRNPATHVQSYLLKPSRAVDYANRWSDSIQSHYNLNGSYLDVHSAVNPSDRIDYDSSVTDAGRFGETLQSYREIYSILRKNHGGPVQGEGTFHLLYVGYADDIEARLNIPLQSEGGYRFPLLVDFDLLKLHAKTAVHGVDFYPSFFSSLTDTNPRPVTRDSVLTYIATELAYGHCGYLPSPEKTFDIGQHAQLEYKYVFSIQRDIAMATPAQILYDDSVGWKTVSDYLRAHPRTYADIASKDFMGQVMVTYSNGVVVCANRHPTRQLSVTVGAPGGWFNYHANGALDTGMSATTTFALPPRNGWVVYDPLKRP